ncbi:MAG: MFS transporter [Chloroflexota bacterium]
MSKSISDRTRSQRGDRNVLVLALQTFLRGISSTMMRAIWQPFVLSLGASMPTLGLLESLGGFQGVVTSLIQPIGGWLSDRRGRKSLLVLGMVMSMVAFSLYALAGYLRNWYLLLPGVVFLGLASIAQPVKDSMVAESAIGQERARIYSLTTVGYAAAGVFAAILAGLMADRWGFSPVFLVGLCVEIAGVILVAHFAVETLSSDNRKTISWQGLAETLRNILVPPVKLRSFYIATTLDSFVWGLGAGILYGMLSQAYGFSSTQFGIMSSISSLSWALSQMPIGRLIERHGRIRFMVISELLGVVMMVGWLFSSRFESFATLQILNGLVPATWVPAVLAWLSDHVPDERRAEEMGRLSAFRGLLSFPAPYIGGLVFERWGFRAPVMISMMGALSVALVLWRFVPEAKSEEVGTQG